MEPKLPVDIKANISREDKNITFDSNVFPKETNKIKKVGTIRSKTFLIKCNGNGHMDFENLSESTEIIKKLNKLRKDGIITDDEFESKKKKLLDKI